MTMLCPVDFSDTSRKALRYAGAAAAWYGAAPHVIHAMPDPTAGSAPALRELAFRDTCAACEVREFVLMGDPTRTILRTACDTHADLIVMGAQGHGGMGALLFDSATQTVLQRATCPVLTARAAT